MNHSFYIAGGDLRAVYLANMLAADGFSVTAFALTTKELSPKVTISGDCTESAAFDTVILPLPASDREGFLTAPFYEEKIPLRTLLEKLKPETVLIGGKIAKEEKDFCREHGITVVDYYEREEFTVRNASLTAEAAVALALELLEESIRETPVLVLGHGRIGRLLLAMLKALDADVTVAARRFSDLAWIRSEGGTPLEFRSLRKKLGDFRAVFNTVPALVLGKEELELLQKDAVLIDLASAPGGVDFEAAEELGIEARKALGLPGKFAPKTAGTIVYETVLHILKEREE